MKVMAIAMASVSMIASIGILGCDGGESNHRTSKKEKQNDEKSNSGSVVIKSREDLNAFLVKGLPISDLVKSLGSPDSVILYNGTGPGPDSGDDWFLWTYYDYPNEAIGADLTIKVRSRVGGFSVGDTVWDWHFAEP